MTKNTLTEYIMDKSTYDLLIDLFNPMNIDMLLEYAGGLVNRIGYGLTDHQLRDNLSMQTALFSSYAESIDTRELYAILRMTGFYTDVMDQEDAEPLYFVAQYISKTLNEMCTYRNDKRIIVMGSLTYDAFIKCVILFQYILRSSYRYAVKAHETLSKMNDEVSDLIKRYGYIQINPRVTNTLVLCDTIMQLHNRVVQHEPQLSELPGFDLNVPLEDALKG